MLNLFCARECMDKEKFIYDRIKASGTESLVLVPNQYTLVAEEQALKYLGMDCLFDVEILSMNRLGHRILAEQGKESVTMLSKHGRFMLLTKIINDHKTELNQFAKSAGKLSFTVMLDDFIAAFKQQNCTMEELESMLADDDNNVILRRKLTELKGIISDYEMAIAGRYTDSEDYIAMYVDAIPKSQLIRGKDIWIYGYDSVTPKFTQAMLGLAKLANSVNFIVNEGDFELDRWVKSSIRARASEEGVACSEERIGEEYRFRRSETIERLERDLFRNAMTKAERDENEVYEPSGIELVQCANQYYEAENAAAYIHHLIRDEGYSLRDITVICNSEDKLQPVVKRALSEYGLEVFHDARRSITDSIGVVYVVNLIGCMAFDYSTDQILTLLKTGLSDIEASDIEDLENYARNYHIRNKMWTRPFKYGANAVGADELDRLNSLRTRVIEPIEKLYEETRAARTIGDFVDALLKALDEDFNLKERNEAAAQRQEEKGLTEDAQRTRSSLEEAYKLLDQMKEILGEHPLNKKELLDIYTTGLSSIEIGMIPPSLDGLSLGTLIRTRPRPNRAVLILGANEGTLPLQPSVEGLFSVAEKAYFRTMSFPLGTLDDFKMLEENAAIYRMVSHPSERLYISYSMTDSEGKELVASPVVDSLRALYPKLEVRKDIISEGWGTQLVNDREETLRHLINHIKDRNTPREGDVLTRALISWYRESEPRLLETMLEAAQDENLQPKLEVDLTRQLYARGNGDYVLSASKIDMFNSCPFKYFVSYGLSPKEERGFNSDPRSIGDLYHEALELAAKTMLERKQAGEELSPEELKALVDSKIDELAQDYNDGLFLSTHAEQFHLERVKEICLVAAKSVAMQIYEGKIEDMFFEEGFGYGRRFKPIELEIEGEKVYIEGKIDRADIIEGDLVRIVDYKTGNDEVKPELMKGGYKMQLMIYMLSATQNEYAPVGIFYFNIKDPEVAAGDKSYSFKLNGRYMDGYDEIMPKSALAHPNNKLTKTDYDDLKGAVEAKLREIGTALVDGDIQASPLRAKSVKLACEFCEYKSICRYDNQNMGNRSRKI